MFPIQELIRLGYRIALSCPACPGEVVAGGPQIEFANPAASLSASTSKIAIFFLSPAISPLQPTSRPG